MNVAITPGSSSFDYTGLKASLSPPSSDVAADLLAAIKNLASSKLSGDGQALTAADVKALLEANTAAVGKAAADAAAAVAAANPTNAEAQIAAGQTALDAAKAAEDANTDDSGEDKETFAGITIDAFKEPYSPGEGEHDISERFSSFLDNVKSSPLFSFSTSFFESFPGGGSPVYQIDGGQTFGTHTIDLSQTLASGLAVLKSILLACFGFLSIRAVIMKR